MTVCTPTSECLLSKWKLPELPRRANIFVDAYPLWWDGRHSEEGVRLDVVDLSEVRETLHCFPLENLPLEEVDLPPRKDWEPLD